MSNKNYKFETAPLHIGQESVTPASNECIYIHPASTTHSQLSGDARLEQGIKPNAIRLSIGTEHIDDSIADLDPAFAAI